MYQLRFAPIIRSSTEKQEKRTESLRAQVKQIKQYVQNLGGTIPESCWKYTSQEYATPDQERMLLNNLLADSGKDIFDAVIVCDASRWSRDNLKSKAGLNILRQNGIKFFVGTSEYDLFKPDVNLFLGMSVEIGEFHATERNRKSMEKRIERAKKGIPTSGKLPYGRIYNKKANKWSIDAEKQSIIEQAAERYIQGENIKEIAVSLGFVRSTLYQILTEKSGSEWPVRFRSKDLNIDETVIIQIPEMLKPDIVEKIHERVIINTKSRRGNRKWFFLLSGFVFCSNCGFRFNVFKNQRDHRYYRHRKNEHNKTCKVHKMIRADELENAVMLQLLHTVGDPERVEAAIKRATPDIKRIQDRQKQARQLQYEIKDLEQRKKRVVASIAADTVTESEASSTMEDLREKVKAKENQLHAIESELESLPDPKQIERASKLSTGVARSVSRNPKLLFEKGEEWKRSFVEKVFAGKDGAGKPLGVYVEHVEDKWHYEVGGAFEPTVKSLPLSDFDLIEYFNLDPDYKDVKQELDNIKSNLVSIGQLKHYNRGDRR
jgi:DNA invertase Pin-like site-specific DNA recombinase